MTLFWVIFQFFDLLEPDILCVHKMWWCNWIPHFSNYLFFQSLEGKKLSKTLNWSDPLLSTFFNFLPNIEAEQHMDQLWSTIEISHSHYLCWLFIEQGLFFFFSFIFSAMAQQNECSGRKVMGTMVINNTFLTCMCAVALRVGITMDGVKP